jgi:integrase
MVNGYPWRETYHGTEEAAKLYLDGKILEFKHGKNPAQSNIDIEHFFEYWINNYVEPQLKHTTCRGYKETIKNHIAPNMNLKMRLKDLTPLHIDQLYNRLRLQPKVSSNIMLDVHTVWGSALERAYVWGFITDKFKIDKLEPVTKKDRIKNKIRRKKVVIWNADQAMDFLEWAESNTERRYYVYLMAFTTGLRRGENMAFQWDKVNFDEHKLKVAASITDNVFEDYVKTEHSVDDLYMIPFLEDKLKQYKTIQDQDKADYKRAYSTENWIHAKPLGDLLMKPDSLSHKFQEDLLYCNYARIKAGKEELPQVVFHNLRHSFATVLYEKFGVSWEIIGELLRHSDPDVFQRFYKHPTSEIQKAPLEKLNELLEKKFSFGGN